jgi:hypothetical protein
MTLLARPDLGNRHKEKEPREAPGRTLAGGYWTVKVPPHPRQQASDPAVERR